MNLPEIPPCTAGFSSTKSSAQSSSWQVLNRKAFDGAVPKATDPQESITDPDHRMKGSYHFVKLLWWLIKAKLLVCTNKQRMKEVWIAINYLRESWAIMWSSSMSVWSSCSLGKAGTVESLYKAKTQAWLHGLRYSTWGPQWNALPGRTDKHFHKQAEYIHICNQLINEQ